MRICQDLPFDKGVDSVAVSIFLPTDVLAAFDSTDHTRRCVFHAPEPRGQGSAKASLICTAVQLVGKQ